jgi:hypothetical protein
MTAIQTPLAFARLRASWRGALLTPDDPGYDAARLTADARRAAACAAGA